MSVYSSNEWLEAPGQPFRRSCSVSVASYLQKSFNQAIALGKRMDEFQPTKPYLSDSSFADMCHRLRRAFQQYIPATVLLNPLLPSPKSRLQKDWTDKSLTGDNAPDCIRAFAKDIGFVAGSGGLSVFTTSSNELDSFPVNVNQSSSVLSLSFSWVLHPDLDKGSIMELLFTPTMYMHMQKHLGFCSPESKNQERFLNYISQALIDPYMQDQACLSVKVANEEPYRFATKGRFNEFRVTKETRKPLEHLHMGMLPVVDGVAVLKDDWYLSNWSLPIEIVWSEQYGPVFFTKFLSVIMEKPACHMTQSDRAYGCLSIYPSHIPNCTIADLPKLPKRLQGSIRLHGTWDIRHQELTVPDVGVFNVQGKRVY